MSDNHSRLAAIAVRAMRERGLEPDFSKEAMAQLATIDHASAAPGLPDLRKLLWCSIDNDDSRDLDQLSVAADLGGGKTRIWVAIADVDGLVKKGTPIDVRAAKNTTSVYTAGGIFPMLPEKLSTGLTSLNQDVDRDAFILSYVIDADGNATDESLSFARVHNSAKLAYNSVAAWLDGKGPLPAPAAAVPGMDAQLKLQDKAAQALRAHRHAQGALELESMQTRAVFTDGNVTSLELDHHNRATEFIEELMVAANGAAARFLARAKIPSLRRVVRTPKRWEKIVAYAATFHETLPNEPDSKVLEGFLSKRQAADPLHFPDVSLAVVKMMGPGEYVVETPGETPIGHFGLAVRDYTHSTAPNRRYPDLITQRMVKAAIAKAAPAYDKGELEALAKQCTAQSANADKVERQLRKSAAAILLEHRIGESFDAIVTGSSQDGVYVRCLQPPVEGRVTQNDASLEVGQRTRVKLLSVNVDRGYIDFAAVKA
jgi:exoribonuclease-2